MTTDIKQLEQIFQNLMSEHIHKYSEQIEELRRTFYLLYNKMTLPHSATKGLLAETSIDHEVFTTTIADINEPTSDFILVNPIEGTMFTPCLYSTIKNSCIDIKSEHYQYANVIDNGPAVCSHPEVISASANGDVPYCSFMHNHAECPHYTKKIDVITSADIQILNTNRTEHFMLAYFPVLNFFENEFHHVFALYVDDTLVNQMIIGNASFDYAAAQVEARQAFDEYVSAYQQDALQISDEATRIVHGKEIISREPNNYFSHVLSLT